MTIRQSMARAAVKAAKHLNESLPAVGNFLLGQINPDGGFKDRNSVSDLYYTVFGIQAIQATNTSFDCNAVRQYLTNFNEGNNLDFVHLACLARCWALLPGGKIDDLIAKAILRNIEKYRSADSGYADSPNADHGTAYAAFLALGAYQDLNGKLPNPQGVLKSIDSLKKDNGSFSNDPKINSGATPATAAVITLQHTLGVDVDEKTVQWLLKRCRAMGGFVATELAPVPDLLSTATALHALAEINADITSITRPCIEFIDSLWDVEGGFCGNWLDEVVDCEYTYYGLLALGHL